MLCTPTGDTHLRRYVPPPDNDQIWVARCFLTFHLFIRLHSPLSPRRSTEIYIQWVGPVTSAHMRWSPPTGGSWPPIGVVTEALMD